MDKETLKKAWNQAEEVLISQEPVEITTQQMASLYGGTPEGWIRTFSADCRDDAKSCWQVWKEYLEDWVRNAD